MVIHPEVVTLSRIQFALTAMFHFLFVPLTLGLSWLLVVMESAYVITNKVIYKDMTQFWGKLFGINLAMAVITGITLEFQFGTNWAYYSQYVGDVFGVPLSIEGMTAFMLEGAFFGMFFFGWNRVSKKAHLVSTIMLALGASLSGLVILIANGWMQHPVATYFNFHTMRMELTNFSEVVFNADAMVRFLHTVAAGYVTGAMFVLSISAWYLLKRRDVAFAKRSFIIAAIFGLLATCSVIFLGDENGLNLEHVQSEKMAAMEGVWNTPKAPAAWNIVAIPDMKHHKNAFAIEVPYALSLIAGHDLSTTIPGMNQLVEKNKVKIRRGMKAYAALEKIRRGNQSKAVLAQFSTYSQDLGYGLLLKKYTANVSRASVEQINKAARDTIPDVWTLFYGFRIMVFCGLLMLLVFALAFFWSVKGSAWRRRWFLKLALLCLPLPWIAAEMGWVVAEMGRQPWTVYGILPTFLSTSTLTIHQVAWSLTGFAILFFGLASVEVFLMIKYARVGPSCLHTGRYHFEDTSHSVEDKTERKN